jgi:hypothetical protein
MRSHPVSSYVHSKLSGRLRWEGLWFQASPLKKKVCETPSQWIKSWAAWHTCHPSNHGNFKIGESRLWLLWAKRETLSPKITRVKRTGGLAEAVECLPHNCKALSSNPNTTKFIYIKPPKIHSASTSGALSGARLCACVRDTAVNKASERC